MERNRLETAIRCLEIAVHPNTNDQEIVAAINGFRRTASGIPLRRLCREIAGGSSSHAVADELQRLARDNLALRQKIQETEESRAATLKRLHDSERRVDKIGAELAAAEQRAAAAEQRLAEFRGAYGRISGNLSSENFDLRRALDAARRDLKQPIHEPVAPFRAMLDAALQGPEAAPTTASTAVVSSPWTA